MKRIAILVVLLGFLQGIIARADSLEEKEKRLADLKQQVDKLQTEIDKEKAGAAPAKTESTLEDKLATLPPELFPTSDESSVKRDMRNDWGDKNLKGEFGPWKFTGTVHRFDVVTRQVENPAPGSPETKKMINVTMNCPEPAKVWGLKVASVEVDVCLDYDIAMQTMSWKTDGSTTITVSGKATVVSTPAMADDTIKVKIEQGRLEK